MSETVTHLSRRCPRCRRRLPPDVTRRSVRIMLLDRRDRDAHRVQRRDLGSASRRQAIHRGLAHRASSTGNSGGRIRVIRLLGRGGMGEVYEAEQLDTGRRLALKVLRDTLQRSEIAHGSFVRGSWRHQSATRTRSTSSAAKNGGAPQSRWSCSPAARLKDRVSAEGPMPPSAAVSAVLDIIGGLDAAQAAGILHRDIKPSNCFVDADGAVARFMHADSPSPR